MTMYCTVVLSYHVLINESEKDPHPRKKRNIFLVSCFDYLYDLLQKIHSSKNRQEYSIYDLGEII